MIRFDISIPKNTTYSQLETETDHDEENLTTGPNELCWHVLSNHEAGLTEFIAFMEILQERKKVC